MPRPLGRNIPPGSFHSDRSRRSASCPPHAQQGVLNHLQGHPHTNTIQIDGHVSSVTVDPFSYPDFESTPSTTFSSPNTSSTLSTPYHAQAHAFAEYDYEEQLFPASPPGRPLVSHGAAHMAEQHSLFSYPLGDNANMYPSEPSFPWDINPAPLFPTTNQYSGSIPISRPTAPHGHRALGNMSVYAPIWGHNRSDMQSTIIPVTFARELFQLPEEESHPPHWEAQASLASHHTSGIQSVQPLPGAYVSSEYPQQEQSTSYPPPRRSGASSTFESSTRGRQAHSCICPECGHKSRRPGALKDHMNKHTGKRPYQCSRCPQVFSSKSNMERHIKRYHPGRY